MTWRQLGGWNLDVANRANLDLASGKFLSGRLQNLLLKGPGKKSNELYKSTNFDNRKML